ncbi:MAG: hypothetical protein PVG96_15455 [Desulfobacterales bacterium]
MKVMNAQGRIGHGDSMAKDAEKRKDRRHACDARIKWSYFNRTTFHYEKEIFHPARVLNFSKSGLYFETIYSLKPGTILLFRSNAFDKKTSDFEGSECLRSISLIEIKWCQEFLWNGESYFGIGARYPIVY